MPLTACGECLKTLYLTETEVFDRLLGSEFWLWGGNPSGNIGNNSTAASVTPTQPITTKKGWAIISTGRNTFSSTGTSAGIKDDGTLWTWGSATQGQLGNNTSAGNRSSPVQTISQTANWKDISVGCQHMAATKQDGTLWTWGVASGGVLGNSTTTPPRSSPVQTASGGGNWRCVSVGLNVVGATKTDGTLWLWGTNSSGMLGNNATTSRSSPVQTISGGGNWHHLSVGSNISGGIKTDGTLWLWGVNSSGQLGNNNTSINRSSPVQTISGGGNWKQLSLASHVTAVKNDGTLWTWGNNGNGQLGNNSTTPRSSPVQTVSGGGNWKQVGATVANQSATGAVKLDGTLWVWGSGTLNLIGSTTSRSSPVQISVGGTNWTRVTGGIGYMAGKRLATCS